MLCFRDKNRHIARIGLGKRKVTVQCPFLMEVNYFVMRISVVFCDGKSSDFLVLACPEVFRSTRPFDN